MESRDRGGTWEGIDMADAPRLRQNILEGTLVVSCSHWRERRMELGVEVRVGVRWR